MPDDVREEEEEEVPFERKSVRDSYDHAEKAKRAFGEEKKQFLSARLMIFAKVFNSFFSDPVKKSVFFI